MGAVICLDDYRPEPPVLFRDLPREEQRRRWAKLEAKLAVICAPRVEDELTRLAAAAGYTLIFEADGPSGGSKVIRVRRTRQRMAA